MTDYYDPTYNYQNPYAAYRPQVRQQQQGQGAGVGRQLAQAGGSAAARQGVSAMTGGGAAAAGGAAAYGSGAGGTIVVSNMAAVPAGYTAIGSSTTGGIMAAPTASLGGTATGTGTAGATGAGAGVGSTAALAGAGLGVLGGSYLLGRGASDMIQGKPVAYSDAGKDPVGAGSRAQLAYSTMGMSEIANALGLNLGSGKGKDERNRDSYRDTLRDRGFLDENWTRQGTGGSFAFGDSKSGAGKDGSDFGFNLDVDEQGNLSNEDQRMMAGSIDPLAVIFSRGNEKQQSDMSGELTNSILGTGGGQQDVKDLYAAMGLTRETAAQELNKLLEQDKIDEGKFNAYLAAIDRTLD